MLSTTKRVKLIEKIKFIIATLDLDHQVLIVYITTFNIYSNTNKDVHLSKKAQLAYLKTVVAFIKVFKKYTDFAEIFSLNLDIKLFKYISIYNYTINLVDNKHLLYNLIYKLDQIELKTLKAYIKNNLANSFFKHSKCLIRTSIFFKQNLNRSLKLYINY